MGKAKKSKGSTGPTGEKVLATNRRASFDYELSEKFEAGLALIGSEARSIRTTAPGIADAFVDVDRNGEAWVKQMRIAPMPHAAFSHDELRPRKLLLNRSEIERMRAATEREGMTLIPTRLYYKNGRAKLELAIARGKKMHDKRQALREKTANDEARAAMSRGRKDY
jgi:SsrA-binding protein